MRKFLFRFCFLLIIFFISFEITLAFPDVDQSNEFFNSILFVNDLGAATGYPDGTFRPKANINRAEFLKILFESFNISKSSETITIFNDVPRDSWFAPYVSKALKSGYVSANDFFRPSDPVTNAEAIVMIGRIKKWDIIPYIPATDPFPDVKTQTWFGLYVAYAKDNNVLYNFSDNFYPTANITRGLASEFIYRTFLNKNTDILSIDNDVEDDIDFTPVPFKKYKFDVFDDVLLSHPFPNIFYKNEIFVFSGVATQDVSTVFAFLGEPNKVVDDGSFDFFIGKVKDSQFEIPIKFSEAGNYQLGIVSGRSGKSKIINISVLPNLPLSHTESLNGTSRPQKLNASYVDGDTSFEWENSNDISKLFVFQGDKKNTYFFRQPLSKYIINYADFEEFGEGYTCAISKGANILSTYPLKIESGWISSDMFCFDAVKHFPSKVDTTQISYSEIPEYYSENKTINITARANVDILKNAGLIDPDGKIVEFSLNSTGTLNEYYGKPTIPANNRFSLNYTPLKSGTHIFSIYEKSGEPAINMPVYFNSVPLVPTFPDLYAPVLSKTPIDISKSRSDMLNLINSSRSEFRKPQLQLDSDLNKLAQSHAEDMASNTSLHHIGSNGLTPDERRKKAGIKNFVNENISQAVSIEYAHDALLRSALHRKNILDRNSTKLGIGIAKDAEGFLYIAQEFSSGSSNSEVVQEVVQTDVSSELLDYINAIRADIKSSQLEANEVLSEVANLWSQKMVDENFTGFMSNDGELLDDLIIERELFDNNLNVLVFESPSLDSLQSYISTLNDFASNNLSEIGASSNFSNKSNSFKTVILYK